MPQLHFASCDLPVHHCLKLGLQWEHYKFTEKVPQSLFLCFDAKLTKKVSQSLFICFDAKLSLPALTHLRTRIRATWGQNHVLFIFAKQLNLELGTW